MISQVEQVSKQVWYVPELDQLITIQSKPVEGLEDAAYTLQISGTDQMIRAVYIGEV